MPAAIITTDVVGCRELIQHLRNGLLIPPKDPGALAAAIETLLDDAVLRRRLAQQGYQDVKKHYTSAIIARKTIRVFDALLRGDVLDHATLPEHENPATRPASPAASTPHSPASNQRVLCVIPSWNGCDDLRRLLISLQDQDYPHDSLVIDSSSRDGTTEMLADFPSVMVERIAQADFGHGKTRQAAFMSHSGYDIYVYLTQDAYFCAPDSLRSLLSLLQNPRMGAACGRQLAHTNATPFAAFSRAFNYPAVAQTRCLVDKVRYGIKTPFLSDSCSAYRATALAAVGGFPVDAVVSEDLYVGARMLQEGWCLAYGEEPEHSFLC